MTAVQEALILAAIVAFDWAGRLARRPTRPKSPPLRNPAKAISMSTVRASVEVLLRGNPDPPIGDLPIVSREIHASANGVELAVETVPAAAEKHRLVVDLGAQVTVQVVDVDSAGAKSEPSPSAHIVAPLAFGPEPPPAPSFGEVAKITS